MKRITEKDLANLCRRLNMITNSPLDPYTKGNDGKCTANIGNYHINYAYGGAELYRMHNLAGGVTNPLRSGHVSKRELYGRIHAFIDGILEAQAEQEKSKS